MDSVSRLIGFVVGACVLIASPLVLAYGSVPSGNQSGFSSARYGPGAMLTSSSVAGLQAQYIALASARLGVEYGSGAGWDNGCTAGAVVQTAPDFRFGVSCHSIAPNGSVQASFNVDVPAEAATVTGCPANASGVSSCTCNAGFAPSPDGASCIAASSCSTIAAANTALGSTFEGGTFKSLTFCNGGCVQQASNGYGSPGHWSLTGTFTATGQSCNATGSGSDVAPKPEPLPAGKCPGTVNGLAVIVPCGTTVSKETEKAIQSDTPASGSSGVISSTEKTTTVTCEGGRCSTSTTSTTTKPDGSSSSTQTDKQEPKPEDAFCKQNPNLQICKNSSAATSCSSGAASVQCDGDAVQCAMLKEQARSRCEFFDKTNDETAVASIAKANGTGGASDHPGRSPVTTSLAAGFDQAPVISGSCPADIAFHVGVQAVSVSFSTLCTNAEWLGQLLVGLTALGCVGIVFKG